MLSRVELQTKRNTLVTKGRAIFDLAAKEKREMTAQEIEDFDRYLSESDKLKAELDGAGGKGGSPSKRLADATAELGRVERRKVSAEQPWGTAEETTRRDAPMRFVNSEGKEVRALLLGESIRSAVHEDLPDGIHPEELSFGRFLRGAATGNWKHAEAEKRALGNSSDVGGGYLVPAILSSDVIDLARNNSVCFKAGALTLPMDSATLSIAKLTQDILPAWKIENQPGAFADAQFGSVKLQARTLMALASISVELLEDAPNCEQLLETSLGKVLALEIDRAALRGDSSASSPLGVKNAQGVTVTNLATNGLAFSQANVAQIYPAFAAGILTIMNKNGLPNAVIYAPRTAMELDQLVDTIGDTLGIPPSFQALEKYVTNSTPINLAHGSSNVASDAILGDFSQMIVGVRTALTVEISREAGSSAGSAFTNAQVWIRALLRADVVLAHPEFFCVLDGIL
jgi:HK97 family phage major capsid protein